MVTLFLAPVAEWPDVIYESGALRLPPCPGPFQPGEAPTAAPAPAPTLAELVKAPAGAPGPALGPFKLLPPGGAVIPILQGRKRRLRENSLPEVTQPGPSGASPGVLSHPLCACAPYPDPLALPSESDSPLLFLPSRVPPPRSRPLRGQ